MYQNIYYEYKKGMVHLWDSVEGYTKFRNKRYAFVESQTGTYMTLSGKKVKRVSKWDESDEDMGVVYEKDVYPETRNLIDKYIDSDEVSEGHKLMVFDIEVSTEGGLPNTLRAENEVTAISYHVPDEYTALILDKHDKIKNSIRDNVKVVSFSTEKDLLSYFISNYINLKPTILTGWNIDFFDIPYLYNRMVKVLGDEFANLLSPIGIVEYVEHKQKYRIAGVSCLDYLPLYKNFTYSQEPSYTLDAISKKELGEGKIEYEGSLDDLFANDIEKFLEYSIHDTRLVKMLDDKMKTIELARGICHKGHVPYEDVYYSSRFLEGAMLVYMRRLNLVAPNKPPKEDIDFDADKFSGAYVKKPKVGYYKWVYDLDMTSLYPSVIMSLNISPETKVGKIEGWDAGKFSKSQLDGSLVFVKNNKKTKLNQEDLKKLLADGFSISSNGILYNTKNKGIIPAILELWFDERVEYKNLMKKYGDGGNTQMYEYFKARQHIQKILLNSLYGVLGLPSFRFYDLDNAEAVTTTGVSVIQFSERMGNYYYNKELKDTEDHCIYCDTDSIFFSALPIVKQRYPEIDETDEEKIAVLVKEVAGNVQEFLNDSFSLFAKAFLNVNSHHFSIKQELISKSGIWLAKKRYAQWVINDNGVKVDKIAITGIDSVRSNFPAAFRSLMKEILTDILNEADKLKLDKKILTFKKKLRILEIDKIAQPTSVKGVTKYTVKSYKNKFSNTHKLGFKNYAPGSPVHVKASIMYNNFIDYYNIGDTFKKIENNEKIKWVYLKTNEFGIEGIAFRGYDDPPEVIDFITTYIDREKIFDKLFADKITQVYEAMKWTLPSESEENLNTFFTY